MCCYSLASVRLWDQFCFSRQMYDLAQDHIFLLMKKDSYPRFLRSDQYKDLLRFAQTTMARKKQVPSQDSFFNLLLNFPYCESFDVDGDCSHCEVMVGGRWGWWCHTLVFFLMVREILKEGKISVREHFLQNQPQETVSNVWELLVWLHLLKLSDDFHVICICKAIADSLQWFCHLSWSFGLEASKDESQHFHGWV